MTNLTGFWEGQYRYASSAQKAVSFDVNLTDRGGRLSGIISEPNTFDPAAGPLLTSALVGKASGDMVQFTKTYVGEGYAQHSLEYEGYLSDEGKHISGRWAALSGDFSGRFEMTRLSDGLKLRQDTEEILTLTL